MASLSHDFSVYFYSNMVTDVQTLEQQKKWAWLHDKQRFLVVD